MESIRDFDDSQQHNYRSRVLLLLSAASLHGGIDSRLVQIILAAKIVRRLESPWLD